MIKYLKCVEQLPSYGVHFYQVKNRVNDYFHVGLSCSGIGQYSGLLDDKGKLSVNKVGSLLRFS